MRTFLGISALLAGLIVSPLPAAAAAPPTYSNPVSAGTVDTFPDPAMIHARDGLWYAYGTQNPVFNSKGEDGERILPILRSKDMVSWEYAGEVFTPATKPAWHDGARLWAPDIRYIKGAYHLYYSLASGDLGLATAPTPAGPWTDRGDILPAATQSTCPTGHIDQAQFTDVDGTNYMYWGSYDVICVARMNAGATLVEGTATQVARGRRMEGGYVVRRGGFYYIFYSDAGCCDGAFSGYQVKVGRSTSPSGPFTDDEGVDLMALTSKGAIVAGSNGNKWAGPGHSGFQTDLAGQDWLVYHAISTADPDFGPVTGARANLSRRPLLIDRLDWIDGWPVVRAGAGPSEGAQPAPVTSYDVGGTFGEGSTTGWRTEGGSWTTRSAQDPHGYVSHLGTGTGYLVTGRKTAVADVRAQADVRVTGSGAAGLTLAFFDRGNHVSARLDRQRGALVTDVVAGGQSRGETVTALPAGFDYGTWHTVVAELRGTELSVQVSADKLGDPVAVQRRTLPAAAARPGSAGAIARGRADADNVGAARLYTPVTQRIPEPRQGTSLPAHSDEFDGSAVDAAWRWVRGPAAGVTVSGGALSWPTQNAELHQANNTASVLLRDAPDGDYTVEAKLRFAPAQGNQQAGILLYENDDRYFKMAHSAIPLSRGNGALLRMSEFAKEGERPTTTPPMAVANAPMFGGPAAETMWLRLSYHHDAANNETEVRAATSRDGSRWVRNGVWTLPAKDKLKIGLFSMNRSGAVAAFDYVRTYQD
ncbi:Beta-xylosidase [Nonomuraea solani]|uniref:Beta-xylosidase n=1 Tax=Nonomuraea solani TaxID=1144553 RepID=A0A1H5UUS2_9ACTN|nr:family 43 glycosylhydrolase [Nonomuraea solani]SEF78720.1 Beta-xylosidase [Nonomuraea solani]